MNSQIITSVVSLIAGIAGASTNTDFQWVQFADNNQLIARATISSSECPDIKIDNKNLKMHVRSSYQDEHLKQKITVCEHNVTGSVNVEIRKKKIKLPNYDVKRFVVIGDSGCESSFFSGEHKVQNCKDPKAWPFKEIADKVAELKADFVVHMGDYAYGNKYTNEADKLKNQQMQWFFMRDDFFKPAYNLLNSTPMLFVRGNHESCDKMGIAWFQYFSSYKYDSICKPEEEPFDLSFNDLNMVILDTSEIHGGEDFSASELSKYKKLFSKLNENARDFSWLLVHQPMVPLKKLNETEIFPNKLNAAVLNTAFDKKYIKKFPVAISGHFHVLAHLQRNSDKMEQFIVGNSGTFLHKTKEKFYQYNDGQSVGEVAANFGYLVFDKIADDTWNATGFDINGKEQFKRVIKK